MKRIIRLCFIITFILFSLSCTNYQDEVIPDDLSVSDYELTFPIEGITQSITVRSGYKWDISRTAPWINVLSINESSYNFEWKVSLSASFNNGFDREGTVTVKNNTESVNVTITQKGKMGKYVAVGSVSISSKELSMTKGDNTQLTANISPSDASIKDVTWSSSNTSVATVSSDGLVTAIAVGSATITAKTNDGGKTATSSVNVIPEGAVDLGLSVFWRDCNVGATNPEGFGFLYAWGETKPKTEYSWENYKWCKGTYTSLTKYNYNSSYGVVDNKTVLDPEDDIAFVLLGSGWRMPTERELTELLNKCTWTWGTKNGVYGYIITSKTNGNQIFLPAAGGSGVSEEGIYGDYWSSSLNLDYPNRAHRIFFSETEIKRYRTPRDGGRTIRPVYTK